MVKKKSVGVKVFLMFLRSFFVVIIMLVVGMISYKATMTFYEVTSPEETSSAKLDIVGDVTADEVSRNIIYAVDPDTSRVDAMVIEVLNTQTGNLDYITVPNTLQFTISNDMYQRLYAAGADAPQIIQMANINEYFKDDTSYEYGILLLEDYFGIDIGYFTKMDTADFNECFTKAEENGWYELNPAILQEAASASDEKLMQEFIKSKYDKLVSDVELKVKQKYAECYVGIDSSLIYYYVAEGRYENGIFAADQEAFKKNYQTILMDSAHTSPQSKAANIPSEGMKIKILNGSGGDGIATATKKIFVDNGLDVVKIADNPDGVIDKTVIYVTKEGMGKDLLYYFEGAAIEVKELEEGVDIMVVVGAADVGIAEKE